MCIWNLIYFHDLFSKSQSQIMFLQCSRDFSYIEIWKLIQIAQTHYIEMSCVQSKILILPLLFILWIIYYIQFVVQRIMMFWNMCNNNSETDCRWLQRKIRKYYGLHGHVTLEHLSFTITYSVWFVPVDLQEFRMYIPYYMMNYWCQMVSLGLYLKCL